MHEVRCTSALREPERKRRKEELVISGMKISLLYLVEIRQGFLILLALPCLQFDTTFLM
jgi:hypothetical protein